MAAGLPKKVIRRRPISFIGSGFILLITLGNNSGVIFFVLDVDVTYCDAML
jgi:hypothetical protein